MMDRLRLITGKGCERTNPCGMLYDKDYPMVGSAYCNKCVFNRGIVRVLFGKFVKCSRYDRKAKIQSI